MNPQIKSLINIGLTEKQAVVYNALLELGEASMSNIANRSKLKRPTVYLIIDELINISLVSLIKKDKKKYYSATHPNRISELLQSRQQQFSEILPSLLSQYGSFGNKPKVQMLEGINGIKQAYNEAYELLKEQKSEGLWFGNISFLLENFPLVINEYDNIISKLKDYLIREIITGNDKSKKWVKKMNQNNNAYHQVKYLNDENKFGLTDQFIIGNKVIFFSMKNELFTLIIESEELAKSQRFIFDQIWNNIL